MTQSPLLIDGALGEGGGQIIRSALALSLVTGRAFVIDRIRANRRRPGLRRQHITAVEAAAQLCDARVEGASLGSSRLKFRPGRVKAGRYDFAIGTAGSTTLVIETLLPALLLADGPSRLTVEGGTHNPLAPPFDFLARSFLPLVARLGPRVTATLDRFGFYPAGGGSITVDVEPAERLRGLTLLEGGKLLTGRARAVVARIPRHVAERECRVIVDELGWPTTNCSAEEAVSSRGPGNVVLIDLEFRHITEVFAAFGERGVTAERVARKAVAEAQAYLTADVPVGVHLADQLMVPLSLAAVQGERSTYRTMPLSNHSATNLEIVKQFLDVNIETAQHGLEAWDVDIGPTARAADDR